MSDCSNDESPTRRREEESDDDDDVEAPPRNTTKCVIIDPTNTPPPSSIRASSRKNRVYVFREFLLQTFGREIFRKDTTILDVAGGKGDLSWLLMNVDGFQNAVIVDPRQSTSSHSHLLKSITYLRNNPAEAAQRAIPDRPTHQPLAGLLSKLNTRNDEFKTPRHLRILVDEELVEAIRMILLEKESSTNSSTDGQHDYWWRDCYWPRAVQRAAQSGCSTTTENHEDEQSTTADDALQTILSTKLIVGFHPDQATEACFELATVLNIPYCVVPCCVFPSEFPNRRMTITHDGEQQSSKLVKTYDEFMFYLQQKYKPRRALLNFHETKTARNVVLYRLPEDIIK